jgi:hypothetical protein
LQAGPKDVSLQPWIQDLGYSLPSSIIISIKSSSNGANITYININNNK